MKPKYVTDYALAKFLGVAVCDLPRVPNHFKKEALVILRAQKRSKK